MAEHPFAHFVRILGKGPRLSRPLTQEECRDAATMILEGAVTPEQLGAFFCLLRVKTETPEELAGFAQAIRAALPKQSMPPVDIDWPSYAGKARRAPLFILAALLLAEQGLSVAMHGAEGHTANRLFTEDALRSLGIAPASDLRRAALDLAQHRFAYVPMGLLHPRLDALMELKWLLGLRSPLHSVIRHLNPFDAPTSLISVFHPNYRAVHRDAAKLLGQKNLACFKGDGGEIERRVEKPCQVEGLRDNEPYEEEWPALLEVSPAESDLDPAYLAALWRGEAEDPIAEAIVTGTAAIALKISGRAQTIDEAQHLGSKAWVTRQRTLRV
ncbi:MAG TPA: glycosyl transferase family protein [Magnetospirillaceae bacterium]|nr:glycosyl transferase family protein [Magnetospirillaceae bacterium]